MAVIKTVRIEGVAWAVPEHVTIEEFRKMTLRERLQALGVFNMSHEELAAIAQGASCPRPLNATESFRILQMVDEKRADEQFDISPLTQAMLAGASGPQEEDSPGPGPATGTTTIVIDGVRWACPAGTDAEEFRGLTPTQRLRACGVPAEWLRSEEELAAIEQDLTAAKSKQCERPFAVGDVVQLRSGGHPMVVTELRCARIVALAWSECGQMQDMEIPEQCLRAYKESDADIPF